ncbi:MAG: flagellar hook-associated protein FlgL [Acidovorax sp.]|uniref:flagellar hook-associated protein FlgL n=1 Tax=Acidovorax sp. TaxID=1872122 RepID=UPI0039E491C5
MATTPLTRVSTATMYDSALRNLAARQTALASLQENLTSGKRVVRASDDPVAAAQAERALTRLSRNSTDQRSLDQQRTSITYAESTLGESIDALQEFRTLVVNAGDGAYTQAERDALASQLESLRDQIYNYANRSDTDGLPLFSGLGSATQPVTGQPNYTYEGLSGQQASGDVSIATTIDGVATWMNVATGNGVFAVEQDSANTGTSWSTVGQVTDPSAITGDSYSITFSVTAGVTTYSVVNTTTSTAVATDQPYSTPTTISFDGMSIDVTGEPADGDSYTVAPSTRSDIFSVMDAAIAAIRNGANSDGSTASGTLTQGITRSLAEIDTSLTRLQSSRSLAGDLLNRADRIENNLTARATQLEADRSNAEDLDMLQGVSDFQNQQVGYEAALQTYAQVQKLSLFNYIG